MSARDDLPRAVARVIGDGLSAAIAAAASAVEGAVRAKLPDPPAAPPRGRGRDHAPAAPRVGYGWAIARLAQKMLEPRGFDVDDHAVDRSAFAAEFRVFARHDCGARLVIAIDERSLVAAREREAVGLIVDAIESAGCYCVRREVIVPCTAQVCAS